MNHLVPPRNSNLTVSLDFVTIKDVKITENTGTKSRRELANNRE